MTFTTRPAPHLRHSDNIKVEMADVLVALLPCAFMATRYNGLRFLVILGAGVVTALICELIISLATRRHQTIGDLSAVVTAAITAFLIPVTAPVWYAVLSVAFAIIISKWLFGGVGKNVFNPALSGVAFLMLTSTSTMSRFAEPFSKLPLFSNISSSDFTAGITALSALKENTAPADDLLDMFIGNTPGTGAACILVILAAALYLLYRRIISLHIPLSILITVTVISMILPRTGFAWTSALYELMSGSLIFCAVFCATDPVSTPNSISGKIFFGIGVGMITMLVRYLGDFDDGIIFAILIMNALSFAMDKLTWKLNPKGAEN